MKILKVEFENINSLAGHWCIDFQDESYKTAHNIFVICGPTGAGKTTILDAITLAIFGRTPRQSKINKSENEIMTRETTSCFSRVTYECETGTYVTEWHQRYGRATKNKAGQRQNPDYKISRIENNGNLITISEGKQVSNALEQENSQIIKLDYTQFCRSIMLAQGEFNKFLTSSNSERAAILEKLDGSEKYRTVAARVYDRFRKEKETYNFLYDQVNVKKYTIKSQEELNELTDEKKQSNTELKVLEDNNKKNDAILNWYSVLEKHEQNYNNAEREFQKADKDHKEFEVTKTILKRAIEAQNCEASYESNKKLHSAQKDDETKLLGNQKQERSYTDEKSDCETKLQKLKTDYENLKTVFDSNSELYKAIRRDDQQIENTEKEKNDKEKLKNDLSKELTKLKTQCKKLTKDLEAQKNDLTEKKQYIEAHKNDEQIDASLPDIKVLAEQLKTAEKDIKTNKRTVSKKEKDLKSQNEQFNELFEKEQSLMGERSKLIENNLTVIVDVLQGSLSEGVPCPVCGSKTHPYCADSKTTNSNEIFENDEKVSDIAKRLKEIIKQLENTTKEKNEHSVLIKSLTNEINDLNKKLSEDQNTLETGFKKLEDLILPWYAEKFELSEIDDICQELNSRSNEYRNTQIKVEKLETSISEKEATLNTSNATLMDKENQYQEHENNFNKTVEALAELKKKRTDLFGNKSVDEEEKAEKDRISKTEKEITKLSEKEKEISTKLSRVIGTINSLSDSIAKREKDIKESDRDFAEKLKENNFDSEESMKKALLDTEKIKAMQAKEEIINDNFIKAKQSLDDAKKYLDKHKQEQASVEPKDEILEKQLTIKAKIEEIRARLTEIDKTLAINEQNKKDYDELQKSFKAQEAIFARWQQMQEWTGKSDGSDLSVFVQSITFKYLLRLANKHLSQMKDRYKLHAKEGLGFEIIDSYYAEPRPDSNISGGEKFLVSLALALGIAEFASKNVRIDSLFLDEGFGSLDNDVLNDVLTCLKREQKNGKLLGIITHVDAVVQSIDQRIEVTPTTNGHSKITGPGVSNG